MDKRQDRLSQVSVVIFLFPLESHLLTSQAGVNPTNDLASFHSLSNRIYIDKDFLRRFRLCLSYASFNTIRHLRVLRMLNDLKS